MSNTNKDIESGYAKESRPSLSEDEELKKLELELGPPATLPTTSPTAPPQKQKLSAATIIPIWIVLSSSVIIYNNYLYNTLGFEFPVFLVTWHLTFAVSISTAAPEIPTC